MYFAYYQFGFGMARRSSKPAGPIGSTAVKKKAGNKAILGKFKSFLTCGINIFSLGLTKSLKIKTISIQFRRLYLIKIQLHSYGRKTKKLFQ